MLSIIDSHQCLALPTRIPSFATGFTDFIFGLEAEACRIDRHILASTYFFPMKKS
jgi:hypothetical protein